MRRLLKQFFDAYLIDRNLDQALSMVSEKVISVGTGEQETARNREELKLLMEREFETVKCSFTYDIRDYTETRYGGGVTGAFCRVSAYLAEDGCSEIALETRLTAVAALEEGRWKFVSLHMSAPAQNQEEEEFFPLKYGRQSGGRPIGGRAERKLIQMMSSMLPGGIMGGYLEKGFPLYVINDTMLRYLGYTYDELVRETNEEMIRIIAPEDREWVEKEIFDSMERTGEYEVQYRVVRKDGSYLWMLDKGNEVITEDGRRAMISVMLDISESVGLQERLRREAQEDELTRILNRKGAIHFIEQALNGRSEGTLLLMDIDNFKMVNDTYGHLAGDKVLVLLAEILQKSMRKGDVVARLGGDEFLVYMTGCALKEIAAKRVDSIGRQFQKKMEQYPQTVISVSTGIVVRQEEKTFEELYRKADDALYQVKKRGKGGYAFWGEDPVFQEAAVSRHPE